MKDFNMNILIKAAIVAGAILGVTVSCSNVYASEVSDLAESVHKLEISDEFFGTTMSADICSAVAISPTQFVTAAHCVSPTYALAIRMETRDFNPKGTLRLLSSTTAYLDTIRTFKDQDVAMLEFADKSIKMEKFATICDEYEPEFGDPLMTISYPRADKKMRTEGWFGEPATLAELEWKGLFWKTSIPTQGGSSGGALFVPKDGGYCLAGTVSANYRNSFETYFSPLFNLKKVTSGLLRLDDSEEITEEISTEKVKKSEMSLDSQ